MKHKRHVMIVLLAAALSACGGEKETAPASASQAPENSAGAPPAYAEGREYARLPSPISAEPKRGAVEIVEFFFYNCQHCYRLQKPLNEWVEASGGRVKKIMRPAVFSDRWAPMAKAFHAMEISGFDEGLHQAIFEEIHVRGVNLDNEEALFSLVEKQKGEDYRKAFEKAYSSEEVLAKLEEDKALGKRAMLEGTPTVVVNGLFSLNSASAQGEENMVPILRFLQQKAQFGQLK